MRATALAIALIVLWAGSLAFAWFQPWPYSGVLTFAVSVVFAIGGVVAQRRRWL